MTGSSSNKQLFILFISSFAVLFVGMGLFPLLPLYAAQFGADRAMIGIFFAVIYVANTAGPLSISWFSGHLNRRSLFIAVSLVGLPALALIGQANSLWQVMALTAIVWYSGGAVLAITNILTGVHSNGHSRGKSFSLISLSIPLGALIGGAVAGYLVSQQGYSLLFIVMAAVWGVLPIIGLLVLNDKSDAPRQVSTSQLEAPHRASLSSYAPLLVITLLSATAISYSRLGTSLSMQTLEFTSAQVASSATVSGLLAIPAILLIGALSDRLGRRRILVLTYILAASGALILSISTQLWHFWMASSMILIALCANGSMTSAYAADTLPPNSLAQGLSLINGATSVGGILSFAGIGYLMDMLGSNGLFLMVAALPVSAAALIEITPRIHTSSRKSSTMTTEECQCRVMEEAAAGALTTSTGCI